MSAGDLALVLVTVVALLAVGALVYAVTILTTTVRELRRGVEELREQVEPILTRAGGALDVAELELARVDGVLDAAESISDKLDSTSRLTYMTVSDPIIKAAAFAAGTTKAARRLRKADGDRLETAER